MHVNQPQSTVRLVMSAVYPGSPPVSAPPPKSDIIEDDDADKRIDRDGKTFFLSGSCSDWEYLIDSYINGKAVKDKIDAKCLVVDSGNLYSAAVSDGELWKCIERAGNPIAIGSGKNFALAFMDTGMTAEEAVRATCKRDIYTGGTIRTFKII